MTNQDGFNLEQLRIDPKHVPKPAKPKKWRRYYVNVLLAVGRTSAEGEAG
jgi:hypothetical protein